MRNNQPPTQRELESRANATPMSTTDTPSHITCANDALIDVSSFSREQVAPMARRLASALLLATPLCAATAAAEAPQWAGFGTLGAAAVSEGSSDGAAFRRDDQVSGPTPGHADLGVDSNLGLQLDWNCLPDLRVSSQLLLRRRQEADPKVGVETLFLGASPVHALELRAGRLEAPVYSASQGRWVDFTHLWMRPPQEVYGLALVDHVDGVDLNWTDDTGLGTVDASVILGRTRIESNGSGTEVRAVQGVTLAWEPRPGWRLRMGALEGRVVLPQGLFDRYLFQGLGLAVDQADWIGQAEVVWRRSAGYPSVDARGWYLLAGRRLQAWTPYAILAGGTLGSAGTPSRGEQHTLSLGLRQDLSSNTAIKVQWDRVRSRGAQGFSLLPDGAPGPGDGTSSPGAGTPIPGRDGLLAASVLSLSISFVY